MNSSTINNSTPIRKHSTRACLECRKRHKKCDGRETCASCLANNRVCHYVTSKRGGLRIPKKSTIAAAQAQLQGQRSHEHAMHTTNNNHNAMLLPIHHHVHNELSTLPQQYSLSAYPVQQHQQQQQQQQHQYQPQVQYYDTTLSNSPSTTSTTSINSNSPNSANTTNTPNSSINQLPTPPDVETSWEKQVRFYYDQYHQNQPFYPSRESGILKNLDSKADVEVVFEMLNMAVDRKFKDKNFAKDQIIKMKYAIDKVEDDLIKIQSLSLGSVIAHVSGNPYIAIDMRSQAIDMVLNGKFQSPRITDVQLFATNTVHELFALDVMLNAASGGKRSKLAQVNFMESVPKPTTQTFQIRYQVIKLIDSALQGQDISESLATWQEVLRDQELSRDPALMFCYTAVNFCQIFCSMPFSTLYQSKSKYPQEAAACNANEPEQTPTEKSEEEDVAAKAQSQENTRICISAANNIIRTCSPMVANASTQTSMPPPPPLSCCPVAMALLVLIKSYDELATESLKNNMSPSDPLEMTRKMKLESFTTKISKASQILDMIGQIWSLSGILNFRLRNLIYKYQPDLLPYTCGEVIQTPIEESFALSDAGIDFLQMLEFSDF